MDRKKIPSFPDKYEATSDGKIIRLEGYYETTFKGKPIKRLLPEKALIGPRLSAKGYQRINIFGKVHQVHRLIAMAFISNPLGLPQINHKNGIKTDNRVENLEWVTNCENRRHAVANGLHSRGPTPRMDEARVKELRALRRLGHTQPALARRFGISQQAVCNIVTRRTWASVTD